MSLQDWLKVGWLKEHKTSRQEITDLFAGGSIRLPRRAAWLEEFTSELLAFPGRHDDQVDALTQALAWGRKAWAERASWGYLRGLN